MKKVSELLDGDRVYGQFLIADCKKGVTTQGKNYLTITLQDSSGSIEGKMWDFENEDLDTFVVGNIVNVQGEVLKYKENLQMKVVSGEKMNVEDSELTRFVPSSPVPLAELEKKLDGYIASLTNPDVKKLTEYLVKRFRDRYLIWPAAVRNHHNFLSGLLYHSLTMADLALKTCEVYPSLNRDVLLAGCIIHDIGKTIELSGPIGTQFTLEGKLLGHISIMQAEVREAGHTLKMEGEIPTVMEHMILSHHGIPEYGSPIMPLTREALALSMIDDFDAKMMILDKAYKGLNPGDFTQRLPTMDDRYFYFPLYSKKID